MASNEAVPSGILSRFLVPTLSACSLVGVVVICAFLASCGGAGEATHSSSTTAAQPPPPIVSIVISPSLVSVDQGASFGFNATVTGTSNHSVTWSVQEGVNGGSIDAGTYLAPFSVGTFHVVATSVADPSKQAAATVTVPAASLGISPAAATLGPLGVGTFNGQFIGSVNNGVIWTVIEGPTGGSIDASGNYVAPPGQGTYHVQAKSVADPSLVATATITVVASGFVPTGSMQHSRHGEKAVLLPASGKVLVTGGYLLEPDYYYLSLPYSELYVPGTTAFQATSDMNQARGSHTATLLADGRVLVTGGFFQASGTPYTVLSNAEIFTPGTGAFTSTGSLAFTRYSHTATLLPSGKVLVTGGAGTGMDTAELWDPSTGSFAPAGTMSTSRQYHSATFLPSMGKVLIVGGLDGEDDFLKSAELYDPATATFSPTGDLGTERLGHTATLLPNGKILITGGMTAAGVITKTTEIYDPATGTFSPLADMVTERCYHTATLLPSGKMLLAGGLGADGAPSFTAELLDPVANASAAVGSMAQPRSEHTATLLPDGTVLVTGGSFNTKAEIYIP